MQAQSIVNVMPDKGGRTDGEPGASSAVGLVRPRHNKSNY
jgi:hypothetical protein